MIETKHGITNKFVGEEERSVGETGISQVSIMSCYYPIPVSQLMLKHLCYLCINGDIYVCSIIGVVHAGVAI